MMKYLISIILCLWASSASAYTGGFIGAMCASSGLYCNPSSDLIGTKDSTPDSYGFPLTEDRLSITSATASCGSGCSSGKLATPYIYFAAASGISGKAKVCVYSDDGDLVPDSGDALVECSGGITATASGYISGSAMSQSVTCGSTYWIGYIGDVNIPTVSYNSTGGTMYYQSITGSYLSPPSNLSGTWSSVTRQIIPYITIGN